MWALRSQRVLTPQGVRPAAVLVDGETIAAVVNHDQIPAGVLVDDAGSRMVIPGLVDTHLHINEPGRTHWEGFETATRAAAAGGITTLIDMPLNSIPATTTVDGLRQKREAATGKIWVDCGFHGGIVPGNAPELEPLIDEGVCAFKAFLCHSGVEEFPNATEADLRAALPTLARAGRPLFVHAELVGPQRRMQHPRSYSEYLATRPAAWEVAAIELLIRLAREFGAHIHIVHLSAALETAEIIKAARAEGVRITVETCPHYLTFAAEEIPDGDPRFKCAPPIRGADERTKLRSMLAKGEIETLGSDHSPAPPNLKRLEDGNLEQSWGGIASLQLLLPACWTALPEQQTLHALSERAAALVGLSSRKGAIAAGRDADLVVFDPDGEFVVDAKKLFHRYPITPYEGRQLRGVVTTTYLRGKKIFDHGHHLGVPSGVLLERDR
ncbi:MAG: allantoinase AllB [Gemmataceae bacterium]